MKKTNSPGNQTQPVLRKWNIRRMLAKPAALKLRHDAREVQFFDLRVAKASQIECPVGHDRVPQLVMA